MLRASPDDEDVTGILAAVESAVQQGSVDEASQAQGNGDQHQRQDDDAAGDVFRAKEMRVPVSKSPEVKQTCTVSRCSFRKEFRRSGE